MAIILPQGRFNNSNDQHIREFISERCRILAVVGLHGNTFKPHTGTKTSVLFVQKWDDRLCPKVDDYNIFFATMQKPGKDNSGEKIYVKDENGDNILDSHGHLIVDHDLYNHDGLTQDGIAEAFIEFAKKEKLSFLDSPKPFDNELYERLLDGLECVEISKSEVLDNNECFRYDAEYFNKEATEYIKMIKSKDFEYIGEEFEVSKLAGFEYTEYFTNKNMNSDENYIALTSKNIQKNFLDLNDYITIDKNTADKFLKRSKLHRNDVILSYTGEYRRALKLYEENYQLGPNVCRIRPKNNNKIKPGFLSIFLNLDVGQSILNKEKTLSAQPTVAMSRIRKIPVPKFSDKFQSIIESLIDKQYEMNEKNIKLYKEVETEFNNMMDYQEKEKNVSYNIKSYKESIKRVID